jgi:sulfur relay (sulfurtransferase) DsrF/TusC family protein
MNKLKQIGLNAKKAFFQLNAIDSKKINKVLNTYNQLLLKNKKKNS